MVKELRDKTGAGMMDCKAALTEAKGDIEQAIDWLRKKGLSKAAKKAGRIAAEGLIGVTVKDKARRDGGGQLRDRLRRPQRPVPGHGAQHRRAGAAGGRRPREAAGAPYPGKSATVEDHVKEMVATIGENMSVRRTAPMSVRRRARGRLRAQQGGRRPRQDRRAGGAGEQWRQGGARELRPAARHARRCRHSRRRHGRGARPGRSSSASGRSIPSRPRPPASPPRSPPRWSKAGCARSSSSRSCCCSRPSWAPAATARRPSTQVLKDAERRPGAPIKITKFVRYALGEGIDKKDERLRRRGGRGGNADPEPARIGQGYLARTGNARPPV